MGDRIAVLQEGGVLAQYATPGGAAHAPRRRLRRGLRRRRPRRSSAWRSRVASERRACEPVDDGSCRSDAPSLRRRAGARWPADARPASAIRCARCASDESLRDALSDLLRARSQLGAGRRRRRARAGRARRRASSTSCWRARTRARRERRRRSSRRPAATFFRDRSTSGDSCVAEQRLLPGLDRRTTSTATCRPFWQHLVPRRRLGRRSAS